MSHIFIDIIDQEASSKLYVITMIFLRMPGGAAKRRKAMRAYLILRDRFRHASLPSTDTHRESF